MTKFLSVLAVLFGFSMVAVDTEAARVGGGKNSGRQSSSAQSAPAQKTTPPQATPTPAAPQSGMSKWLGPLAGLAAGIGLASLLGSGGLGAAMGGLLMVILLAGVAFVIYRLIKAKSQPQSQSPLSYAGAGNMGNTSAPLPQAQPAQFTGNAAAPGSLAATVGGAPVGSSAAPISAMAQQRWPADFDAAAFERQAISGFNRLQAANDAGDASTLRDFLTPELFKDLEADMKASWGGNQKTEAVDLKAEVLEVVTEGGVYVASVKFSGQIRENGVLNPLNEMWHMEKPVNGSSGWRVAGIQQVS